MYISSLLVLLPFMQALHSFFVGSWYSFPLTFGVCLLCKQKQRRHEERRSHGNQRPDLQDLPRLAQSHHRGDPAERKHDEQIHRTDHLGTLHEGSNHHVRILCKYLHSNGYDAPCAFHPAPHVNKCFVPHIFTKDEIERLFSAVDCTKESSESPLRHLVMPVLFRLLYTCGLRVSEALHLKVADVDLDAGVLAIYGAKGDKERLVGISDSMLAYMKSYRSNPLVTNAKSIYFFPAPDGGFYDTSTIYDIFRKCLFDAGIPHRGRGKGPRLHDLRHSFAVHILNKWSSEGKDIYTCLPILRTALGHDRITTTEKYLRLVPEAYMEVTEPFNDRFHTITEVLCNEE